MCAHVNFTTLMMLAEIRQAELLEQAEHYRLLKQAATLNVERGRRGTDFTAAVMALRARLNGSGRRSALTKPIDLAAAATD
ncbi:MAG: hypothetical protein H0T18_03705 [Chloroflexia bacterium]|nr:hypothetical protein [Chloroflexia bacterium]